MDEEAKKFCPFLMLAMPKEAEVTPENSYAICRGEECAWYNKGVGCAILGLNYYLSQFRSLGGNHD